MNARARRTENGALENAAAPRGRDGRRVYILPGVLVGLCLLAALAAPVLAPYSASFSNFAVSLTAPSWTHLLGADELGRDVLSRIVYGARYDVGLTALGILAAWALGLPFGLFAGLVGGRWDSGISSVSESLLTFPSIVLAIVLVSVLQSGTVALEIAIVATQAPVFVRFTRMYALRERGKPYVESAIASGATRWWLMVRTVLPNVLGPSLVLVSLGASEVVLLISALGFLGLGVEPPAPEWGAMLSAGQSYFVQAPYLMLAPGAAIFVLVLGLNLLGEAVRVRLDPKRS